MSSDLHFLVVDDCSTMRHILINFLRGLGYRKLSEAEDGEKALQLLHSKDIIFPVRVVITDWNMPIMDGLVLLQRIRGHPDTKKVPVILITAESKKENIIAAVVAGADAYIVKPFNSAAFKEKIDQILHKRGMV